MVKRKRKANPHPVRSIIDHTTTCPYCGHRLLHKNRAAHIKKQHPDHYDSEIFAKHIDQSRKPAICPHCQASMLINELESHIQEKHPLALRKAEERVQEKERFERAEKRKRRARIAQHLPEYGYSVRIERPIIPIRGSISLKHKPITAKKKKRPARKKTTRSVVKSKIVSKSETQSKPSSSILTTPEIVEDFFCQTCGRNIVGQVVAQHQREDFFLRRQVRWWMAGNGSSSFVQCPMCDQVIAQTLLSSHLEENHPIFYRFAIT